jgi:hypothetical protein
VYRAARHKRKSQQHKQGDFIMSVVVVARWKGDWQKAMPIVKEVPSFLKEHGAVSARAGTCYSGPHAGDIYTAVTFPHWEAFGRGHGALTTDPQIKKTYAEGMQIIEVQDRSIMAMEDL